MGTATLKLIIEGAHGEPAATHTLGGEGALLGRDPDACDVRLDSKTVSGRHGLVQRGPAGFTYTDLASRNGSAILRGGVGNPAPVAAGLPVPVQAGDVLLLGGADAPARIRLELGPEVPPPRPTDSDRTVVARAALTDLRAGGGPDPLVALSARSLAAPDAAALAEAAVAYLREVFPHAGHYGVRVMGAGFSAWVGDDPPRGLEGEAAAAREVVLFEEAGTPLPPTESIAAQGVRAAVVAPLLAGTTWHGYLACWTPLGAAVLPEDALPRVGVAAGLLALSASKLAVIREGEAAREALEAENTRLRGGGARDGGATPLGDAPGFVAAVGLAQSIASADVPLLLTGETGTGKEVLARAVHRWSRRSAGPMVVFNCAAVPENLLESELFGHVRGAFTGASADRQGLFEAADGGTLFLDEIGEMPPPMQAKLLRVLQDGEVRRVGATATRRVDVRVLSATHRDLEGMVEEGTFRADLMYRLNAVTVRIPPLRERGGDVALLAHHLLGRACQQAGKRVPGFTPEALAALGGYDFPGNVRELDNEVLRAVALTEEGRAIAPAAFSGRVSGSSAPSPSARSDGGEGVAIPGGLTLREAVAAAERQTVRAALAATAGNVSQAAKRLGVTRPGLYKVMDRLDLRD